MPCEQNRVGRGLGPEQGPETIEEGFSDLLLVVSDREHVHMHLSKGKIFSNCSVSL